MDKLYENIGKKFKLLAMVSCVIESFAAVIAGIAITPSTPIGLLFIFFGPVVAWVLSWMLYGFGELIDRACEIADNTKNGAQPTKTQAVHTNTSPTPPTPEMPTVNQDKIQTLDNLLSQGLITEEEYQTVMKKYQ